MRGFLLLFFTASLSALGSWHAHVPAQSESSSPQKSNHLSPSEAAAINKYGWQGTWDLSYSAHITGTSFPWEFTDIKDTFNATFGFSVDAGGNVNGEAYTFISYSQSSDGCASALASAHVCTLRCKGSGATDPLAPVTLAVSGQAKGGTVHLKLNPPADLVAFDISSTCVGEVGTQHSSQALTWFCAAGSPVCAPSTHFLEIELPLASNAQKLIHYAEPSGGEDGRVWIRRNGCDPDALARAEREFATGNSFAAAASKELHDAASEFTTFEKDYGKESGEVAVEKTTILHILKGLDAVLEAGPLEAYADVEAGAEVAGVYGAVIVTIEALITKIYPAFKERSNLATQADADLKRAQDWWARGNADLKQALDQGPCIGTTEERLNKALADQKRTDQAREVIDSWENNGYQYLSPIDHEVLSEAAALKLARSILDDTAARASRSLNTGGPPTPEATRARIKATSGRLREALGHIESSIGHHDKAVGQLDQFQIATAKLVQGLGLLPRQ